MLALSPCGRNSDDSDDGYDGDSTWWMATCKIVRSGSRVGVAQGNIAQHPFLSPSHPPIAAAASER